MPTTGSQLLPGAALDAGLADALVERDGKSALVYVDDEVKEALRRGDGASIAVWRNVGREIAKLLRH